MVQKQWLQLKIMGTPPHPPSRENPVCIYIHIYYILCILYIIYYMYYIYILYRCIYKRTLPRGFYIQWRSSMYITYIMSQSGHLLQNLSTLCVIYIVYIVTCLFSVRNTMKYLSKEYLSLNILKIRRTSLRLVFLMKVVYNEFLLLKNYRLWHWIGSFVWFIPTNLESVVFD